MQAEAQKPRPTMPFSSEVAAAVANLPLPPEAERAGGHVTGAGGHVTGSGGHMTGSGTLLPEVDNKEDAQVVMEPKTEQTI